SHRTPLPYTTLFRSLRSSPGRSTHLTDLPGVSRVRARDILLASVLLDHGRVGSKGRDPIMSIDIVPVQGEKKRLIQEQFLIRFRSEEHTLNSSHDQI